jgi:hypothetical protein
MPKQSLALLLARHRNTKINDLPTDVQVLFGFLTLLVDIKYRNRYGSPLLENTIRARMDGQK